MTDPNHVRKNLHTFCEANSSETRVKHNRYYYILSFENNVGWDWVRSQVQQAAAETDVSLEPYRVCPGDNGEANIEVRETGRRSNIDDDQGSLFDYE